MTALTTSLYIIAYAGLFAAWWIAHRENKKQAKSYRELQERNISFALLCATTDPAAIEYVIRTDSGMPVVCKLSYGHLCTIKKIQDEDFDFAMREAEELLEILNSK